MKSENDFSNQTGPKHFRAKRANWYTFTCSITFVKEMPEPSSLLAGLKSSCVSESFDTVVEYLIR